MSSHCGFESGGVEESGFLTAQWMDVGVQQVDLFCRVSLMDDVYQPSPKQDAG